MTLSNKESGDSASTYAYEAQETSSRWRSFKDSFKAADTVTADDFSDNELDVVQRANQNAKNSQLSRRLKNRHLQMIAIGGSIGTGLFVGLGPLWPQVVQAV